MNRLIYMPLGGAGEIGMNMYVYGYGPAGAERLIVIDAGITFPDMDTTPGVEWIMPDCGWLEDRRDRVEAIFLTHAHEDHVGAAAMLHRRIGAPIIARPFTREVAARRFEEFSLHFPDGDSARIFPQTTDAGPFKVAFLPISHSVPEAAAMVIDSPLGRVIHTGDFKLDAMPVLGERFDPSLWRQAAEPGVLALACDSTNVFSLNPGRSESLVGPALDAIFEDVEGVVAATTFASNVARVKQLADAATRNQRQLVFLGRAMERMLAAAETTGILERYPNVISPRTASTVPRGKLMIIATGSQGEYRSATAKLSSGGMNGLALGRGDVLLFSSKTIPGNEMDVARIMNRLSENGVKVIDDAAADYHVSGHANRPDLEQIHDLVAPRLLIPMHGEHRHLDAHARLAESRGLASVIVRDGQMLDIASGQIIDRIATGRTYLDGTIFIGSRDGILRDRLRMARAGNVAVSVITRDRRITNGSVKVIASGLPPAPDGDLEEALADAVRTARMGEIPEASIRRAILSTSRRLIGKSPQVSVIIHDE